ncbi:MAG: hypothetical protein C0480_02870 [Bradyrhizobium sp.]|nr:hypothetical protein [Bradyrhizobium sp.]
MRTKPFAVIQHGAFLFIVHAYTARQARSLVAARLTMQTKTTLPAIIVIIAASTAAAASFTTISGPSRVLDGDTVAVGNIIIRLKGVDAPERSTDLGEAATTVMKTIVGTSNLTCSLTGEQTHRREVGYCSTADGTDINQAIIEHGAALSCPRFDARYLPFEQPEQLAAQPRATYCVARVR